MISGLRLGALLAAALAAPFTSTPKAEHTLQVAIYDTLPLARSAISTMQATVDTVLEPASIRVSWTFCSGTEVPDDQCSRPRPRHIVVRIIATHKPRAKGRCGFAVPDEPGRGFISLAVDCTHQTTESLRRNWKLAHAPPVSDGQILGYMLAHEVAHLLLGDVPHAAVGLFKHRLARRDWSDIERKRLTFRPHEIARMRAVAGRLANR